jgi:CheY-like chemotaxis protein
MTPRILVAGRDAQQRAWLRHYLQSIWPDIDPPTLGPDQLRAQASSISIHRHDALVLCTNFASLHGEESEGISWLRTLRRERMLPPIVVVAAQGNELAAVRAIRYGAAAYLPADVLDARLLGGTLRRLAHASRRRRQRAVRAQRRPGGAAGFPQLPGYTLLHELGRSARAAVWLARSDALERPVALKVSLPAPPGEPVQAFANEYAAVAALRHPAIVDIHDYGVHDGREFIAMEYFPCGDLRQRLQHPIRPAQALQYARRIAMALEVVHAAGMLHRDLKPPNIMLRSDGSTVLIDFGLAKLVDSSGNDTALGVLRGSPYYMSPEQAQGMPLDARSDLYSMGVICFEMLTGRKPFHADSPMELMEQHVSAERPDVPDALGHWRPVLSRLMARDREQRFQAASEVLAALDALVEIEREGLGQATGQATDQATAGDEGAIHAA